MGKIRWSEEDPKNSDLNAIQITYNKLARLVCNVTLKDRKTSKSLFEQLGWFSFNQINAQVKMTEAWKMETVPKYPNAFKKKSATKSIRETRAIRNGEVIEPCTSAIGTATFISDAARAWNRSSASLRLINSISGVKKEIKKIVKLTIPF